MCSLAADLPTLTHVDSDRVRAGVRTAETALTSSKGWSKHAEDCSWGSFPITCLRSNVQAQHFSGVLYACQRSWSARPVVQFCDLRPF